MSTIAMEPSNSIPAIRQRISLHGIARNGVVVVLATRTLSFKMAQASVALIYPLQRHLPPGRRLPPGGLWMEWWPTS